jgi:PAS domain S-box-containing protein
MKLFQKDITLSLRAKLTLLIESFVIILVLVTGIVTTIREKETLERELRKRGLALASDLARFMVRPLLSRDLPTLRRFVNQSMEQEYVLYVVVLDPHGNVVMHNDLSEVGKTFSDRLSMAGVQSKEPGYTDVHGTNKEELHSDIFAPIRVSEIRLGTVRLGYSHRGVEKEIAATQQQILMIGLLTTLAGGLVAYLLATFISFPIKKITDATKRVADGDLSIQVGVKRNDEIGALANAFNKMTGDLRKTTVSKEYFDNIIKSMNDTLIVVGPDARIKSVNEATCKLLEYPESELVGRNMDLIFPPEEKIFKDKGFQRLMEESAVVNREIDYVSRSGKRIPMLLSASVLKNKEGTIEGAVCIAKDATERKQAVEALRESEKALHFLSSQLLTAQERERRRLSIELHDELGQSLMVLKLKLRSIRDELGADHDRLRKECDEVTGYVNEITENVRRLSRDLSPSVLEDLGLSSAIQWLVEAFTKHSQIGCSLDMTEIEYAFSNEEQIIIYRMIQECLTNIGKHAQASHVSLAIGKNEDHVLFSVEDNGIGFNVREVFGRDPRKKGLGLAAMVERARMLRGSLDISSHEGSGTKITFTVPLHDKELK